MSLFINNGHTTTSTHTVLRCSSEGERRNYIPVKLAFHDELHFSYYKYEMVHQVSLDSPWKNVYNGYYFACTPHLIKPIENLC
jgi:hypothetical protein